MITLIPLGLVFILGLILYARWNYGVLEAMGVPVVPPSFLFGSTPDLHLRITHEEDMKNFKKYGAVYGVYEGRNPFLYVCDPDLVQRITVTDFEYFRDRRHMDFGNKYFNEMFDFLKYDKWKIVRSQLMTAFSPAKIKQMKSGMDISVEAFLQRLGQRCGVNGRGKVDLREKIMKKSDFENREIVTYIIDFSTRNLYAVNADSAETASILRKAAEGVMGYDDSFNLLYSMSSTFPVLTRFAPTNPSKLVDKLRQFVDHVFSERRSLEESPKGDFVDRLLSLLSQIEMDEFKKLNITEVTIYAQAIILFFVSFETLTAALVFLFYFLAQKPEAQGRLYDEIDSYFRKKGNLDVDSMQELPFLTACLQETLRLVPAQRRIERMCVKDYEYKGLKIKKGINIMIPLFPYHRNPEYFEDPDTFMPERFLPENSADIKPFTCSSFGHGPRGCAGQRYSLEVLRFSAARMLHKFRFEVRPDTQVLFKPGRLFLVQYHPVTLNIIKRCKD